MSNDFDPPDRPSALPPHVPAVPHREQSYPTSGSTKALIGLLLAGTAGLLVLLFVHLSNGKLTTSMPAAYGCTKGQRDCLPDVNYVDTTGQAYSHDSLAGKIVLVNFWATWCGPCKAEIPDLSRTYSKFKDKGVVFLGVMTDSPSPDSQSLLNFQSDFDMSYPVVRANSDLMVSYNYPDALPTTFVFDRHGKQVFSHVGPLRGRELDSLLDQLVARN